MRSLLTDRSTKAAWPITIGRAAFGRSDFRTALPVLALLAGVIVIRLWVLSPFTVSSPSMSPTIQTGDLALVEKVSPRLSGWHRGEIVVFRSPEDHQLTVKRIVGLPGERVEIEDRRLVVNGKGVHEPYADNSRVGGLYFGPVDVPRGSLFLLGDSRFGSIDSRVYGPVKTNDVVGRVLAHHGM